MTLNVDIIGVGTAGSYLGALLSGVGTINVKGYEGQSKESYISICAWATNKDMLDGYLREIDLHSDSYVLAEARVLLVELGGIVYEVPVENLVTIDKPRLILDVARKFEVEYSHRISRMEALNSGIDVIVDTTGVSRGIIGKPTSGDRMLPTYQLLVEYGEPPFEDFYVKPFSRYAGYLWYFPLGGGRFFVGAGDAFSRHLTFLRDFLDKHRPTSILWRGGRSLRIKPPGLLRPLIADEGRPIVAVGEAAGTVFPILGEGILPSLESARILADAMSGGDYLDVSLNTYVDVMERRFSIFRRAYRFVSSKQEGTCNMSSLKCIADAISLSIFFLSKSGRKLTGIAPRLRHVLIAVKPF